MPSPADPPAEADSRSAPPTPAQWRCLLPEQTHTEIILEPCSGGWNNRVWRVAIGPQNWLLKQYFRSARDPRPRLKREYTFLQFAADTPSPSVPRPVSCLPEAGFAVYEWIAGEPYAQIGTRELDAALAFLADLQARRGQAGELGPASEFCRSARDHLHHLQSRSVQLEARAAQLSNGGDELDAQVADEIRERLMPLWREIRAAISSTLAAENGFDAELGPEELCVSPSDFGFHNALQTERGPVFLDFEYAGWDDPAQLVCDFFCQFERPAPQSAFAGFASEVAGFFPRAEWQYRRMQLLMPIHRLKWLGIALNHFLPEAVARRHFSATTAESHRILQLEKIRNLLENLEKEWNLWRI